jgi:hypothetical protein
MLRYYVPGDRANHSVHASKAESSMQPAQVLLSPPSLVLHSRLPKKGKKRKGPLNQLVMGGVKGLLSATGSG